MDFSTLADYFNKIESVSSRLEMTSILAEIFNKMNSKDTEKTVYFLQGNLGPRHTALEAGMGEGLIEQGIVKATGYTKQDVETEYRELGDLGLVAEKFCSKKKQQSLFVEKLSIEKVFSNFIKMSELEGKGSQETKLKMFAELINSATGTEAKFITRIPMGNLRLGVGDPTIMDAFALNHLEEFLKDKKLKKEIEETLKEKKDEKRKEEFERKAKALLREKIEAKYNIYSDLGSIAEKIAEKGLKGLNEISIEPGTPIRPTLAERLPSAEKIIEKLGKCAVEAKYDGFRIQCHKKGNEITIFSRQSENMTHMFPDIVEAIKKIKPTLKIRYCPIDIS